MKLAVYSARSGPRVARLPRGQGLDVIAALHQLITNRRRPLLCGVRQVTIQDLEAGIAKTPASAQTTWEQATLAIALMERLEKIDRSLEALRQSILSI